MDRKRIQRLRRALREEKLDALVLRLPENIVMALGVWPMNGFSYAVVTAEAGPLALIAPSCEDEEMDGCWADHVRYFTWPRLRMPDPLEAIADHLRDIARPHGLARARIGYEGSFDAVAPPHNAGEVMVEAFRPINSTHSPLRPAAWSIMMTTILPCLSCRIISGAISLLGTMSRNRDSRILVT